MNPKQIKSKAIHVKTHHKTTPWKLKRNRKLLKIETTSYLQRKKNPIQM